MIGVPLSVLEVLSVDTRHTPADVVAGIGRVARCADELGYRRVWYAEHHGSPALLDFPPAVLAAHAAALTSTIRVGSGGVLTANHAALSLAEQFGALAALHPGRIDLGIGRGPGTLDPSTARALRRGADPATDEEHSQAVTEILRRMEERPVCEPWLLASSPVGAALAARLGLPLAFAYHIRPSAAAESIERYHRSFQPSRWMHAPRVMLSVQAICAESDAEAAALARPVEIHRAALATRRADEPLLDADAANAYVLTAEERAVIEQGREHQIQGSARSARARLRELADRYSADELMLFTPVSDGAARARSFELIMGTWR